MDQIAGQILTAVMQRDFQSLGMILAIFAIANYGTFVVAYAVTKVKEGFDWARGKKDEIALLRYTNLDERFLDLLEKAVSNQAHLKAELAEMVADGKIEKEELGGIVEAVWEDFKANLSISDWRGFGIQLLGNSKEPGREAAVRAKFDANVHSVLGDVAVGVSERRIAFRGFKARGGLRPPSDRFEADPS